jgi:hypothetical protein
MAERISRGGRSRRPEQIEGAARQQPADQSEQGDDQSEHGEVTHGQT